MLFHYLRPDPDSLDPVGRLVDRIRLACLAMDLAGIAEHAFNLPEVDCSDADAGFIDVTFNQLGDEAHDGPFSNAASCAGIENDIKLYLVNKQLKVILRLDDELHADPELTSLGALLAMHRDYKCTSTLLVTDHAGKQITKGPALGDSSDWHVNESNMGEWDITRPTQVLTPEQTQNPPSASMLSERGVVELLATLEKTGHHKHNDPTSDWVFRHGPTARERFDMCRRNPVRRQRRHDDAAGGAGDLLDVGPRVDGCVKAEAALAAVERGARLLGEEVGGQRDAKRGLEATDHGDAAEGRREVHRLGGLRVLGPVGVVRDHVRAAHGLDHAADHLLRQRHEVVVVRVGLRAWAWARERRGRRLTSQLRSMLERHGRQARARAPCTSVMHDRDGQARGRRAKA